MRKVTVVLAALLVVSACGDSSNQAATTIATTAPATTARPLVDLVTNYHSHEFLPVPEDFAREVRQAGLMPLQGFNGVDPEFSSFGGPWMAGEFCPGLSWMAAALDNKKVSIQRMGLDQDAMARASGNLIVYAITVTAIHDVGADEFASALDEISIATGGNRSCPATAKWAAGTRDKDIKKFSVVELSGADLDTSAHKIRISPFRTQGGDSVPIVRSVDFGDRGWAGGLDRGEYAVSVGLNKEFAYVETQMLLHLDKASTALHIHTWAVEQGERGIADLSSEEFFELEELVTDFAVDIIEPTTSKLLGWLVAHQAFGE